MVYDEMNVEKRRVGAREETIHNMLGHMTMRRYKSASARHAGRQGNGRVASNGTTKDPRGRKNIKGNGDKCSEKAEQFCARNVESGC